MPKYLIERIIPGAGKMSSAELKAISQKSCDVIGGLGPDIEWLHSYVTDDAIHCVYNAASEEIIREHAMKGGFPANKIMEVRNVIDPSTAVVGVSAS